MNTSKVLDSIHIENEEKTPSQAKIHPTLIIRRKESKRVKSEKYFDAKIQQSPLLVLADNCSCGQFITSKFSLST
ncbi:hypothetical protein T11_7757 [Trichinella zimbabwensis]|uniref:Uncharacterized protein n=1 Tax=Trichinella zimbabwensis TaxID=268475 RepID=A0A0V1GIX9_9BILA|nr:hypothetical protein T11_7757 [Trichinella zimbabwensis]